MNRVEEIKLELKADKQSIEENEKRIQDCLNQIRDLTHAINNCYVNIKLSEDSIKKFKQEFFNLTSQNPEEIK